MSFVAIQNKMENYENYEVLKTVNFEFYNHLKRERERERHK